MRVLRPSLAQHRADFEKGSFSKSQGNRKSLDDLSIISKGAMGGKTNSSSNGRAQGAAFPDDSDSSCDSPEPSDIDNESDDPFEIEREIARYERDTVEAEADSERLMKLLTRLRSSDESTRSGAISELLKFVDERNTKLRADLDEVRLTDRLVLEACTELKFEIQYMRLLGEIEKIKTMYRFEHPCGEIFLATTKGRRTARN